MVHIINSIHSTVQQNINAITRISPHLSQLKQLPTIYYNQHDPNTIPILSGGGSVMNQLILDTLEMEC